MCADYPNERHRRAANRLTYRFGGTATLTCVEEGGTDGYGNPTTTETDYDVRALDTGSRETFGTPNGVDAGERIGIVNVLDTEAVPKIGDRLTLGGETIFLLEVEPIQPNPDQTPLAYRYTGKP